jgi:DNA-binding IclR family transcriptional regulator
MACIIADAKRRAIARIDAFHARRFALGVTWPDAGGSLKSEVELRRRAAPKKVRSDPAERGGEHQNIARTSLLLSALAEASAQGLRLTDVVEVTGLGKATAYRILNGLVAHGLAEQDAAGRFFLGMRVVGWAAAAADRFGLLRLAAPILAQLATKTEDTVYLSLRSNDEAVCIGRYEGAFPIKTLTLKLGDRRPLGVGAGSLAILAFLPPGEIERILAAQAKARRAYPIDDPTLRKLIERTRRQGYALNDGYMMPDMSAVGVPLTTTDGLPVGAVSVAAISTRLVPPRREEIVSELRRAVVAIDAQLQPLLATSSGALEAARR